MQQIRSPQDICLICQINNSDKKGSHFTPIGILKQVVGERDYEHEITIDPDKGKITERKGRSNLSNTNTEIVLSDNVANYIFCSECEKRLGLIESECIKPLNDFANIISALSVLKSKKHNSFFTFQKPNKNVVSLLFYSIIWRQILNDSLQGKLQFDKIFFEQLRLIVYNEIYKTIKEIEQATNYHEYPSLILLTSDHSNSKTTGFIYGPYPVPANPETFAVGLYTALIFTDSIPSQNFAEASGLNEVIVDQDLIINHSSLSIIGVLELVEWRNHSFTPYTKAASDFSDTYINRIIEETGLSYDKSKFYLQLELSLLDKLPVEAALFEKAFRTATENLIEKFKSGNLL